MFPRSLQSRGKISPNCHRRGNASFWINSKSQNTPSHNPPSPFVYSHKNVAPFLPGLFPSKAYLNRIDINVLFHEISCRQTNTAPIGTVTELFILIFSGTSHVVESNPRHIVEQTHWRKKYKMSHRRILFARAVTSLIFFSTAVTSAIFLECHDNNNGIIVHCYIV